MNDFLCKFSLEETFTIDSKGRLFSFLAGRGERKGGGERLQRVRISLFYLFHFKNIQINF